MSQTKELLIEIGTEELPPKALKRLAKSFANEIQSGLETQSLSFSEVNWYATPRRLAVIVEQLAVSQQDREVMRRGPALAAAYDKDGKPSKAAEGFSRSCNVSIDELEKLETDKGAWLIFNSFEKGKKTTELVPDIINIALNKLPIPKRMRWGDRDTEFVRPVHWSIVLLGNEVIPCSIMGTTAGNKTYGHRFHHPKPIQIKSAAEYLAKLEAKGYVIADFEKRKNLIEEMVNKSAEELIGSVVSDPDLLEEVTSLVEWPAPITGSFDKKFLDLPKEVLIASMKDHQRYFSVQKKNSHDLINNFITISNIDSKNSNEIKVGNEKVIRPRLSDAEFFWKRDSSKPLSDFGDQLKDVIFQKKIGTLADKTERVKKLTEYLARLLEHNLKMTARAAGLSKCDLFTEMVGEFPELQGVMGKYYALQCGEPEEVAIALDEQYMPRFAGDKLPESQTGQLLAIADKLDTMVGIFGIGQVPTGDRDPFALRRAAIGILRIIAGCKLPIDLDKLIEKSIETYGDLISNTDNPSKKNPLQSEIKIFLRERARNYLRDLAYTAEEVDAVLDLYSGRAWEYLDRLKAVREFMTLPEATDLAEANKRINNIITKSEVDNIGTIPEVDLFETEQERVLFTATSRIAGKVNGYIENGNFREALHETASLHGPVTDFFEHVMVNVEDERLRNNRFSLLNNIAELTNQVANISKLAS